MGDPETDAAKKAIADDSGADRGNDVTGDAADDKVSGDGTPGETPPKGSVEQANAAGVNPDKG